MLPDREEIRLLNRAEDFSDVASDWRALEAVASGPLFFQSHSWCAHVARTHSTADPGRYEPLVAVYRRRGRTAAIWPLSRQKRFGLWQLRNLDDPYGQFGGVLALDPQAERACVAMALDRIRSGNLASQAILERLPVGAPALEQLLERGGKKGDATSAATVERREASDFAAYRDSRRTKTMKNLRNVTRKLERAGEVEHRIYESEKEVSALVGRVFESRKAWMVENGMMTRAFRTPGHREVLSSLDAHGPVPKQVGFELLLDGEPIAHQWGYLHGGRYYAYMSGAALDKFHLSPGRIHLARVIEAAFDLGVEALELLTPASRYKMSWANLERPLVDVSLNLDRIGAAKGLLWDDGMRPLMKNTFYSLPTPVRRLLAR